MVKLKEKKVERKKVKAVTQKTKKTVGAKTVGPKVSLKPKEKAAVKPKKALAVKPKTVKRKTKVVPAPPAPQVLSQEPQVATVVQPSPPPPPPPVAPERVAPITKPVPQEVAVTPLKELELGFPITVKDLAVKLQEKPSTLIKILMDMRIMVGINQTIEEAVVSTICEKYHYRIKKAPDQEELALRLHKETDTPGNLKPRFPIVTLMGHVDHGKTSLLDAIRKSKVVDSEHGGITQHIGAYRVILPRGEITFLDTPGHEAFTAMRARGAGITDIVVLVVAADDGMMPQTEEAIDHARAAGVPIIVAVNKMDKPGADIDRVKKQLSKHELTAEDWGGKTITVPVSAKTGQGIDDLLEMILLEAQMLELKANPNRAASGVVIESKMAKGRGPVATLLIHSGTLHLNENIIVGTLYGKIRAMFNDRGQSVTSAGPSSPVEALGVSGIPAAGEPFFVIEDEKEAKELAAARLERLRFHQMKSFKRISLEDLHAEIEAGKIKELKLIIKADVQGSLEAIRDTLNKINVSEIKLDFIHTGVGNINASDAILAVASNALILGFNIAQDERSKEIAAKEGLDIRTYNIIYELANDIKAALEGMLDPKIKKVFVGRAEIRKVLKLSRAGTVSGCFITKGNISRNNLIHVVRNGEPVFEGKLSSLRRFKDDVREVNEGFECGLTLTGFDDVHEGDLIEAFEIEKIARKL